MCPSCWFFLNYTSTVADYFRQMYYSAGPTEWDVPVLWIESHGWKIRKLFCSLLCTKQGYFLMPNTYESRQVKKLSSHKCNTLTRNYVRNQDFFFCIKHRGTQIFCWKGCLLREPDEFLFCGPRGQRWEHFHLPMMNYLCL